MTTDNEITMYLFVNTDLGMRGGKLCAQVGHVVQLITEDIIRSAYETPKVPEYYFTYMKWKNAGHKKIVLKATELQLRELMKLDDAYHIIDQGRTQVPENSLTVVGFKPSDKLSEKFRDYKLLG